ncbi:MAG: ferrous iron transport protein B, partial [Clostridia bacterium]|nr:ferrous iron transport protein B [Clostridia bacterium]
GAYLTRSDKIDRILTNRILGIPIFLVIMFFVFHFTFSEDLFFMNSLYGVEINWWVFEECGVPSLGVFLQSALGWCTDSLTDVVGEALASSAPWVGSLICDGLFAGVFGVLSFLPQIALLFVFLSILEDSGYMARAAFIMDRAFRKFGLSGKSFMPLLMGFGCSVPAMMATRTLEHEKERTMTIYMTPWFSCSAKMPIYSAIAAAVFGGNDLAVYGMYLLGIACAIIGSLLLRHTAFKGETAPFIMELPAYHLPQARALGIHVWDKVKKFIIRAGTIIAASTIVIWFLSNFSWSYVYLDGNIEESILHDIGSIVAWIFYPLGFGLGKYGWVFIVAALTGLIAKEEVVSTLAVLGTAVANLSGGAGEEEAISALFNVAGIGTPAVVAFMAFNLLAIPCFAAVGAARSELGKGKTFKGALLWWILSAYVVSMLIFLVGSWWWTCFIFIAIIAAVIALIVLHNKGKLKFISDKFKKLKKTGEVTK